VSSSHQSVLLLGPPGSGKGTQGKLIGAIPGIFHHSSGDIFRHLDPTSEIGKVFAEYSRRGELVPDEVTIDVWRHDIARQEAEGKYRKGRDLLVLDGIPRDAPQAAILDADLDVLRIVHLWCDDEDAFVQRLKKRALKEGRSDDADEGVIRNRFEVYRRETQPVLDHYPDDIVSTVDAIGPHARVLRDVLGVISPIIEDLQGG
jgi:adenylate kinase